MKTFEKIQSDLTTICQLFKLGQLKGYKTENHSIEGFMVAKFETTVGFYKYIFKN